MRLRNVGVTVALAVSALLSLSVRADAPGKHPAYLHALSDLRAARGHLQRPEHTPMGSWDEKVAIAKIDDAINEIKRASIDDGKNLNDHPPVDAKLDWPGRIHRALELTKKAHEDVNKEEDNAADKGLRNRVLAHITGAEHFIEQGIANNH